MKVIYLAFDGKQFSTREKCLAYEKLMKKQSAKSVQFSAKDAGLDHYNVTVD